MPLHVVLVRPEIPPNTGNIVRLCAATRSPLHLVHPLGFRTDDRSLKRAGVDGWEQAEVCHHRDLDGAIDASGRGPILCFSARGDRVYTDAPFADGARLVFGPEATGLPPEVLARFEGSVFRIPLWGNVRSLNLSNAVAVALYEGYRRLADWGDVPSGARADGPPRSPD